MDRMNKFKRRMPPVVLSLAMLMGTAPMLADISPAWALSSSQGMDVSATIPGSRPAPDPGSGGGGVPSRPKPEIEKNPDGSTTEVIIKPNGTKIETTTWADGKVEVHVKLPSEVVRDAADRHEPLPLPIPSSTVTDSPVIRVDLGTEKQAVVKIPVSPVSGGSVAVLVKPDGSREVVRKSAVDENGLTLMVENGAVIEIVNRAGTFSDINSHWGKQAIDFVAARELFQGVSTTEFAPDAPMTRAMFATVLWRLEGEPSAGTSGRFVDVPENQWYTQAVNWAAGQNIVNGYGERFAPDDLVTRQQLAAMMYRYADSLGLELSAKPLLDRFRDGAHVADWARTAMNWAVSAGLIQGKGNSILDPEGHATRAEVAAICQRMVGLLLN